MQTTFNCFTELMKVEFYNQYVSHPYCPS